MTALFFDRPPTGSRALLVHIEQQDSELASRGELQELAGSAGLVSVGCITSNRKVPHPATLIGRGKIDDILQLIAEVGAEMVVFDAELSPSQERNLESALACRVLARTGLILEIFGARARTAPRSNPARG